MLLASLGIGRALISGASGQEQARPGAELVAEARSTAGISQPAPVPEIVVYGVTLVGQDRSAFVAGPQLPAGRIRRVIPGMLLGSYRVSRIEVDGVVLEKDGVALRVPLGGPGTTPRPGTGGTGRVSPTTARVEDSGPAAGPTPGRPPQNPVAMRRLRMIWAFPLKRSKRKPRRPTSGRWTS